MGNAKSVLAVIGAAFLFASLLWFVIGRTTDAPKLNGRAPTAVNSASNKNRTQELKDAATSRAVCDNVMRTGLIAEEDESLCGFDGGLHAKAQKFYANRGCGKLLSNSQTEQAASDVLGGMRNEYAQDGKDAFCKDADIDYRQKLRDLTADDAQIITRAEPADSQRQEPQHASCGPEDTFHLERLKANSSLKVVSLGEKGVANVQRFLELTMQNPIKIANIPNGRVWVSWQYKVASLGGSPAAQGVIDIVQDDCVMYRRQGDATEIVAIANGDWSR